MRRFGRVRRDLKMADPELLRKYTAFEERISVINKKFDELMTEVSKAEQDLERLNLDGEATKMAYHRTKLWDIKNDITKIAAAEPLLIIKDNLGLLSADGMPLRGPYRSW